MGIDILRVDILGVDIIALPFVRHRAFKLVF